MNASTDRAAGGFGVYRPMCPPAPAHLGTYPSASAPSPSLSASTSYEERVCTCVRRYEQDLLALEDRVSALRAWTFQLENLADDVVRSDMLLRDADAEAFGLAAPIVGFLHSRGGDAVGATVHGVLDARDEVAEALARTKREIEDLHDRHRCDLAALEAEHGRERRSGWEQGSTGERRSGWEQGSTGERERPCEDARGFEHSLAYGSIYGLEHGSVCDSACGVDRDPVCGKERERHENRG